MTLTLVPGVALGAGLLPLALGEALMGPVMVAAVHRYTTTSQRSISFSIFYAMMNLGFLFGGLLFDHVREALHEYGRFVVPILGVELSAYRTLFLLSFLLTLPNLLMMGRFLREGVEVTEEGVKIRSAGPKDAGASLGAGLAHTIRNAARETIRIFAGLWRQPGFYKFLSFLALAALLRLVIVHMYYTYPKFGIRELGPGAPIGRLWSVVNSALVIILVPLIGAFTQKISAYRMVVCGSTIAALSVFIMAMPPHWFQSLADGRFGHLIAHVWLGVPGPVNPYYVIITIYVLCWTVGESIYSPRLYEYAAAIAPKGQEASYMALSYLPFFLAKVLVTSFSGELLARFCPPTGPRHSQTLWLIIALMTVVGPIGLVTLRRFIRVQEAGRE
jgi:hypothetical protein